jgi:hypothetical protein
VLRHVRTATYGCGVVLVSLGVRRQTATFSAIQYNGEYNGAIGAGRPL